jgi:hypothetical protein
VADEARELAARHERGLLHAQRVSAQPVLHEKHNAEGEHEANDAEKDREGDRLDRLLGTASGVGLQMAEQCVDRHLVLAQRIAGELHPRRCGDVERGPDPSHGPGLRLFQHVVARSGDCVGLEGLRERKTRVKLAGEVRHLGGQRPQRARAH